MPKTLRGENQAARNAGISTLIKSYSMSHLTPPRVRKSSRQSTDRMQGLEVQANVGFKLPHIDDVEDVEEIEHDLQASKYVVI